MEENIFKRYLKEKYRLTQSQATVDNCLLAIEYFIEFYNKQNKSKINYEDGLSETNYKKITINFFKDFQDYIKKHYQDLIPAGIKRRTKMYDSNGNIYYREVTAIDKRQQEISANNGAASVCQTIRGFIKYLIDENLVKIDINKWNEIKFIYHITDKIEFVSVKEEEIQEIMESIENSKKKYCLRDIIIFEMIFILGLRSNEMRSIKISDIDFNNHILFYKAKRRQEIETIPLKLPEEMSEELKEYIETERIEPKDEKNKDILLISQKKGKFTGQGINDMIQKRLMETDIDINRAKKLGAHRFRAGCITCIYENSGHDLVATVAKSRHANPQMLKIYVNVSDKINNLDNDLYSRINKNRRKNKNDKI